LQELIKSIGQIDFEILAFPNIEAVRNAIEDLKPFVYNEDGSFNKANKSEYTQFNNLQKELKTCHLSKNHYLMLCVEQLIKIANADKWGLCRKNGFIYLYNGRY